MDSDNSTSESDDEFLIHGLVKKKERNYNLPKIRKFWVHETYRLRRITGEFITTCLPLMKQPDKFYRYFRMSVGTFNYILNDIKENLGKKSIRTPISPCERLCVTLRYLTTGLTYQALSHSFKMSPQVISIIVPEVCEIIFHTFVKRHMSIPSCNEFVKIANDFEKFWNFPNVLGAIDGKHFKIKRPAKSGSLYYNYKGYYSIVMQAVADSNCRFLFVDVGAFGKQSDGGVYEASSLSKFMNNPINLPEDRKIGNISIPIPYFLVADDAYPLCKNIMKPFNRRNLTDEEFIFNGRLSRARKSVECAFGILAHKFRIFFTQIETDPNTTATIIKCATMLHNIIIDLEGMNDIGEKVIYETRHNHKNELKKTFSGRKYNHSSTRAIQIREKLADYFIHDGAVPWQSRYLN